ncbi:uncharacterized protein LOC133359092 [Lethenteron reissneri]|uniref:uncharacterized protein LOC133359092 n=1 Tax=Lethenteron reissneri TaxID=7753 RepID=UPI002AB5EF7B|nr:uncharacterized protein LOC133359092 [Lethenteron reissneri]
MKAYLPLLLVLCQLILPCYSKVEKEKRKFTDVQVQEKCKFSLEEIHDCKYTGCLEVTTQCGDKENATVCQFTECISVKTKCEEPLNQYLTPEEICEGDAFDQVDLHCLINSRQSYDELTACKGKRYASARKQCFQSIYKKKIEAIAKKQLNLRSIPDRVLECALDKCYKKTEECLEPYHLQYAKDPASLREFQLEHCAYVAKDFPHYCETMECTKEVDACGMQNRNLIEEENGPNVGLIAGIVGGLLVAIIAVACVVLFIKKRSQSRGSSPNGRGSPVQFSQVSTIANA